MLSDLKFSEEIISRCVSWTAHPTQEETDKHAPNNRMEPTRRLYTTSVAGSVIMK